MVRLSPGELRQAASPGPEMRRDEEIVTIVRAAAELMKVPNDLTGARQCQDNCIITISPLQKQIYSPNY